MFGAQWGESAIGDLCTSIGRCTMSTSFSGIGAPEMASTTLTRGLRHFGYTVDESRNLWALDINDESRYELMMGQNAPEHVFGDLNSFIQIGVDECKIM